MARLLAKDLHCLSSHAYSLHHKLTVLSPILHFSTQIQEKKDLPFMAQYLISSFGFSEERALRVTTYAKFARIKTHDRPDSVLRFLKDNGFNDSEIQSLISWNPRFLGNNVEKTLKPRFNKLVTAGFGGDIFIQLIKSNPVALNRTNILPALQFWRSFVGNNDKSLLDVIKGNAGLMNMDIDKQILPRLNLLREYGLSDKHIVMAVTRGKYIMVRNLDNIKELIERTENLGFQPGSVNFVYGLMAISSLSKDTVIRKINFFRNTCNFSEEDVKSAIKKNPCMLNCSEEKVKSTMDFLLTEIRFHNKIATLLPSVLKYSLERRLIPRNYVITVLRSKGIETKWSFKTVVDITDEKFVEKFIAPHKEKLPKLGDSYAAYCEGKTTNLEGKLLI